jgi:anaerobic magnesium-protoporphyrin IX monomethyl ester cyclase
MKKEVKIAFVSCSSGLPEGERFPLIGIAYLVGYLKKSIPNAQCLFFHDATPKDIESYKPDLIAFSSATPNFSQTMKNAETLRAFFPDISLCVGGPHISAVPASLIDSPFDFGVIGEGEETFCEVVVLLQQHNKKADFLRALHTVSGLVVKKGNEILCTPMRPLIADLDIIPHPDIDILLSSMIGTNNLLITSRGCPYACAFCASGILWRRTIRYHSANYVVSEIKERIRKYGSRHLFIKDDLFTIHRERLKTIAELLKKEGLNNLEFDAVKARANMIDDELCVILKSMNVTSVNFGFESGSLRILNLIKDGPADLDCYERAIKTCHKHGIDVLGTFIIGNPTETNEDIQKTYDFIKKHRISSPAVFIAAPYPKTRFWDFAQERGLIGEHFEWSRLTQHTVFFTDHVSESDVYAWEKKFLTLRQQKNKEYIFWKRISYLKQPWQLIRKIFDRLFKC